MKKLLCSYCEINEIGNKEHVFPKGLGGENVRMDCICDECNNFFSKLERELYQKSMLAIPRLNNELPGYNKISELSFHELLSFDKDNKIAFEMGYTSGLTPYVKVQVFEKGGQFWADGNKSDNDLFNKALNNWVNKSLKVIFFNERKKRFALFKHTNSGFNFEYRDEVKNANNCIEIRLLSKQYKHYEDFTSRIFLDKKNNKKLVVRAKTNEFGLIFLTRLLNKIINQPTQLSKYPNRKFESGTVRTSFSPQLANKALVKIGLNCLLKYYPNYRNHKSLKELKMFVLSDKANINVISPKKMDELDSNLDKEHYVVIYQLEERVDIRIGLFSATSVFGFMIPNIKIMPIGNVARLLVNYKDQKNIFEKNWGKILFDK